LRTAVRFAIRSALNRKKKSRSGSKTPEQDFFIVAVSSRETQAVSAFSLDQASLPVLLK
jgi:hypothetical protein